MEGLLITFEGGDGAGKSTLMQNLYENLVEKGESVIKTRAPGGTDLGDKIRSLLLHEQGTIDKKSELFLFLADRAQHVHEVIVPALLQGKIVLCDRFNDSTVAYQGAARGLDPMQVSALCDFATNGLKPNLTFYLDIDPLVGLQRSVKKSGTMDRMESESLSFHERLRTAFHSIALGDPSRIHMLDGSLPLNTLLQQATRILDDFFKAAR
ncbi:MAG: dTMP kinase [Chlamydiota bacterium]